MKYASRLISILLVSCMASCSSAEPEAPRGPTAEKALAVVERSKSTRATYALYSWNRIKPPGEAPLQEWAAEFHSGTLHRVETPRDRIIADCAAQTGTHLSLVSGEKTDGKEIALAACGINTNKPFLEASWASRIKTRFGKVDRIRLVDADHVRHYDVSDQGALVGARMASNAPGEPLILVMETIALSDKLPGTNMFDQASLERSFVSEQYRHPPTTAPRSISRRWFARIASA